MSQGGTPLRREAKTAANDTLSLVKLTDHGARGPGRGRRLVDGHDLPGEQPERGGRTDVSSAMWRRSGKDSARPIELGHHLDVPSSARGQRFPQPRARRA